MGYFKFLNLVVRYCLLFVFCNLIITPGWALIPARMNIQGKITPPQSLTTIIFVFSGNDAAGAARSFSFTAKTADVPPTLQYDAATGIFNAVINFSSAPDFLSGGNAQVTITAGTVSIMQALNTVPYAQRSAVAENAETLGGQTLDQVRTGAGNWTLTGTNISNTNTGNVGIGTTAPGVKLDAIGANGAPGDSTGILKVRSGTTLPYLQLQAGVVFNDQYTWIQATEVGSTNDRFLALNPIGGNVGIGTTAPGAKLEVAGQVKITGGTPGIGKVLTSDNAGLASWQALPVVDLAGETAVRTAADTALGGRIEAEETARTAADATLDARIGERIPTGTAGQTLRHDAAVWAANSTLFNDGTNVGIGTTAPGAKLEVAGQVKITGGTPGIGKVLTSDNAGLASWQALPVVDLAGETAVRTAADTALGGRIEAEETARTAADATESETRSAVDDDFRVRIDTLEGRPLVPAGVTAGQTIRRGAEGWEMDSNLFNTGTDVGIGTTAPTAKLHVEGAVRASDYKAGDNGDLIRNGTLTTVVKDATNGYYTVNTAWPTLADLSGIGGAGTVNYLPKFATASTLGNSLISDDGSQIKIGNPLPADPLQKLYVEGDGQFLGTVNALRFTGDGSYLSSVRIADPYTPTDGTQNFTGRVAVSTDTGRAVFGQATGGGNITNYGGRFEAAGNRAIAVYGGATASGAVANTGGRFEANGNTGIGVFGEANAVGAFENYGGQFTAKGNNGRAVYGIADAAGSDAAIANNRGGLFVAAGNNGTAVEGQATAVGDINNLGGLFSAAGRYGYGVQASATGSNSRGVYGFSTGNFGVGVYGEANNTLEGLHHGGLFTAIGANGRGVEGQASGTFGIGVFGTTSGDGGFGVSGHGGSGSGTGVRGFASIGEGIYGESHSNYAIHAKSRDLASIYGQKLNDPDNDAEPAVYGKNEETNDGLNPGVKGESVAGYGVIGSTEASNRAGVYGINSGGGTGVLGFGMEGTGVYGRGKIGLRGYGATGATVDTQTGTGVIGYGIDIGVSGESRGGIGVYGTSVFSYGIHGKSGSVAGIFGEGVRGGRFDGTTGYGVQGNSDSGHGVVGTSASGSGVRGSTTATGTSQAGVTAVNTAAGGVALRVQDVLYIVPRSGAPSAAAEGMVYYDSGIHRLRIHLGSGGWDDITSLPLAEIKNEVAGLRAENQLLKAKLLALEEKLDNLAAISSGKLKLVGR